MADFLEVGEAAVAVVPGKLLSRWYQSDAAVGWTIFLFAFAPRVLAPAGGFMDTDSGAFWLERIKEFVQGIQGQGLEHFVVAPHPGVTLLWISSLMEMFLQATQIHFHFSDPLGAYLHFLKIPVMLTTSLMAVVAWYLLKKIVVRGWAVAAALLFALDPLYLVFSRYLHLDALFTGLALLSLLAGWLTIQKNERRYAWLTGILIGLTILTRINGLIVAAYVVMAVSLLHSGRASSLLRNVVLIVGGMILTIVILWPPVLFLPSAVANIGRVTAYLTLHDHEVQPLVDVQPLVRALLYPLFILCREFLPTLALAVIGLWTTLKKRQSSSRRFVLYLIFFSLVYTVVLLIGPKKIDRYILPVVGPLCMVAGYGVWFLWQGSSRWKKNILLFVVAIQMMIFWSLAPFYQTYFNLLGRVLEHTPLKTSEVFQPAWGEGIREALTYVQQKEGHLPPVATWYAGVACAYGHVPTADNYPLSLEPHRRCPPHLQILASASHADYLFLSRDQIAQRLYPGLLDDISRLGWQPEHIIRLNGLPYIIIYRNQGGLQPLYELEGRTP